MIAYPHGSLVSTMRPEITNAFELLRSGSPAHVEQAPELLQTTVFSFSMTVCGHREDAEDSMQDVLVIVVNFCVFTYINYSC